MCGLTGFLGTSACSGDELMAMTSAIAHRGPNSQGHWQDTDAGIALGHRRLAVVDLTPTGHQPMMSADSRFVLVFNGEIYNHKSLRLMLEAECQAPVWRGHSDTETLLAGFCAWGIRGMVERCIGMFAFAVWDAQERVLTLVRDRMGEKPLYYGWQGKHFLFGSELKALKAHPDFSAKISRDALQLYMRHACVPGTHCIYEGIHKLEPGCLVSVSQAQPTPVIQQYWSLADVAKKGKSQPFEGSPSEAVQALSSVLKDAIGLQMMADVPLGAFLSGGIDSSTVVALMQEQSSRPIRTFSIGFDDAAYNEAIYAKEVAKHLGTAHTELYVSPKQAMEVIPLLPQLYDEPFADSSQIPTFLVSQMARQHVTVALSGDAGDELFAGYNRYQVTAQSWQRLSALPLPLRRVASWAITRLSPSAWNRFAAQTGLNKRWADMGYKLHKGAGVMAATSADAMYTGLVSQWQEPRDVVKGGAEPPTKLTGGCPDLTGLSTVERMMALDMLSYLPDDILTKVDRAAMGVGLETRVPFLDHRVVEFAWALPLGHKLCLEDGAYTTKWALRQVLYQHVPKALIDRPKMGFGIPIDSWLRGPLRDWAEDLLSEERLEAGGYFEIKPIRQKWAEHLSGQRNWQHPLWCVLMFQAWLIDQHSSGF